MVLLYLVLHFITRRTKHQQLYQSQCDVEYKDDVEFHSMLVSVISFHHICSACLTVNGLESRDSILYLCLDAFTVRSVLSCSRAGNSCWQKHSTIN